MIENLQKALFAFWGGFGVPAYIDGLAIGTDSEGRPITPPPMPYITFNFSRDDFFMQNMNFARIWTFSTGFTQVWGIAKQIEKAIPIQGKTIEFDGGAVVLRRGTPFMQPQPQEDQNLRVFYINIETTSYMD